MTRPARLSLLTALIVVVAVVLGVSWRHTIAEAPVRPEAAGLTGELWVMPGRAVPAFLKAHDAPPVSGMTTPSDPMVVGRVAWTGRPGGAQDERFTVLLGDDNGGAGSIQEVPGQAEGDVSLGSGSMWNRTVERTEWLRGSRPVQLEAGGWADYGTFASLPVTHGGFVWFVGRVTDAPTDGTGPTAQGDARPVVGVALSTGDRVWWVKRVASAHVERYGG